MVWTAAAAENRKQNEIIIKEEEEDDDERKSFLPVVTTNCISPCYLLLLKVGSFCILLCQIFFVDIVQDE